MRKNELSRQRRIFADQSNHIKNRDVTRVTGSLQIRRSYQMNGVLLVLVLLMIAFGLVMLFSASMSEGYANNDGNSTYYVLRQASFTALGLVLALIIAIGFKIDFFDKMLWVILLYALTTALLLYVAVAGIIVNAARRWIQIGSFTIQPSELAKVSAVLCLAGYFSWRHRRHEAQTGKNRFNLWSWLVAGWVDIYFPAMAMLLWLILILRQPHLSGTAILAFVLLTMFVTAGLPVRSWLSAITQLFLLLAICLLIFLGLLKPAYESKPDKLPDSIQAIMQQIYPVDTTTLDINGETIIQISGEGNFAHVKKRLDAFFNPEEADEDDQYQSNQAIIALGSGGLTGVGLGKGRQKYNYLPEAHNDYVFPIIGEELGFIGTLSVLFLFICFLIVGVITAFKAKNIFAASVASGFTALISVQALLNMGVAARLLPATGISLPFFSYGGTSNLFFLLAVGFLLAVSRTGQKDKQVAHDHSRVNQPQRSNLSRTKQDFPYAKSKTASMRGRNI